MVEPFLRLSERIKKEIMTKQEIAALIAIVEHLKMFGSVSAHTLSRNFAISIRENI